MLGEIRLLRADEIDVRISTCNSYGVGLLLYKDARCDMNILDETFGPMNWQRSHSRENQNCTVSVWDESKQTWVSKEDTGTESYTEKEKGLASDSFKRACFNWGIGRELYTAPNMFVFAQDLKTFKENNGKWTCKDYFTVDAIQYKDRKIVYVRIINEKTDKALEFGSPYNDKQATAKQILALRNTIEKTGADEGELLARIGRTVWDGITAEEYNSIVKILRG